jgi:hypothetical protein
MVQFISFAKPCFEIVCTKVLGAGELSASFATIKFTVFAGNVTNYAIWCVVLSSSHVPNGLLENMYNSTEVFGHLIL